MFARRPSLVVVSCALIAVTALHAQDKKFEPGVRGRFVISPELMRSEWPMNTEEEESRRAPARVRRPTGRTEVKPLTEPRPELLVVLEGARSDQAMARKLVVQGHRFVPGQLLLPKAGPVTIENKMAHKVTVLDDKGRALVALGPGEAKDAPVAEGVTRLTIEEMPYARATVRALDRARVLPVKENGDLDFVAVDAGDYKLVFYHGAEPVYQQPLQLPEDKVFFIDASVSAKAVVTVALKDATVRIAIPQGIPLPPEPGGATP